MSMPGGYQYESPEARRLGNINPQSYDYRDQTKVMSKLVNDVSYMAGMQRKMQKGIDSANQNFVQQLQSLINDVIVILGGGGDTGLDFGDLKYIIQAIGALFGLQPGGALPINLFQAAWHFFSNYIVPTGNFEEVVNTIIDGAIASILDLFGEVPIAGQALQQLAVIITELRDSLFPIIDALEAFFGAFSIDLNNIIHIDNYFGPMKPVWDAFVEALDGIDIPNFVPMFHELSKWTTPFVNTVIASINVATSFIKVITGQTTLSEFEDVVANLTLLVDFSAGGGIGLGLAEIGEAIIQFFLNPTGMIAMLTDGLLDVLNIPDLDASKITSGIFALAQLPSQVLTTLTGVAANLITGIIDILRIPDMDASKIITGTFDVSRITGLLDTGGKIITTLLTIPASIITGVLDVLRIPGLDASKIISGTFAQSMLDITNIPANIVDGVLDLFQIPGLPASKIVSGTFGQNMIDGLVSGLAALLPKSWFSASRVGGSNLVISPNFEDVSIARRATGAGAGYSTDQAHSGMHSFMVPGITDTFTQVYLYGYPYDGTPKSTSVQPGQVFYMEAWVYADAANTGDHVMLFTAWFDSTGVNSVSYSNAVEAHLTLGQWTKLSGYVTVPAGKDLADFIASVRNDNATGDKFYWDDVVVRDVTEPQNIIQALFGGSSIGAAILSTIIPGLDTSKITSGTFPQSMLNITSIAANIISGVLAAGNIPNLNASKITAGILNLLRIPDLDTSKITSGTFPLSMITGLIDTGGKIIADLLNVPLSVIDGLLDTGGAIFNTLIPALHTSKITSGTFPQSMLDITSIAANIISGVLATGNIPNLDAGKITTGLLNILRIPDLNASKITAGILNLLRIPDLDTSKITSGTFPLAMISGLIDTGGKIITGLLDVPLSVISGLLDGGGAILGSLIPGLDASKITSGTFAQSMVSITSIAANLVTGVLTAANIPGLAASKITSGLLSILRIPDFDTSKITSGTFPMSMIAGLLDGGGKIIADLLSVPLSAINGLLDVGGSILGTLIPGLDTSKITSGTFPQSMLNITSIAASIVSGVLATTNIPNLNASKITAGILNLLRIPNLDASKITSGTFPQTMLNITSIAANLIDGVLDSISIPDITLEMSSAVQDAIDSVVNGLTGLGETLFSFADVKDATSSVASTVEATSVAVAAMQQDQQQSNNGGKSYSFDFSSETNANSLPAPWSANVYTRVNCSDGYWAVQNGSIKWHSYTVSGANDVIESRVAYSVNTTAITDTDYQKIGAIWDSVPTENTSQGMYGSNSISGRSNLAGDTRIELEFRRFHYRLLAYNSGVPSVLVDWTLHVFKPNNAYYLELGTTGSNRTYRILDGTTVLTAFTDSGAVAQLGASYRRSSVGSRFQTGDMFRDPFSGYVQIYLTPGNLVYWQLSDNTPAATLGSGIRRYRSLTTNVNALSGDQLFPNNFFDTLDRKTSDITDTPNNNNAFTITISGWYMAKVCVTLNGALTSDQLGGLMLYRNGSIVQEDFYVGRLSKMSGTWLIYCTEGDVLQPGYNRPTGTDPFTGGASGSQTYWEVALMNRSLN